MMEILLDTHIFLWYITKDSRLPDEILPHIRNVDNQVYLSVISLWEVLIKYRLGKLTLPESPEVYFPHQRERHQIISLPLDEASVKHLAKLPDIHRDPFDRMLVCQAIQHGLILATVDEKVKAYPVRTLPA